MCKLQGKPVKFWNWQWTVSSQIITYGSIYMNAFVSSSSTTHDGVCACHFSFFYMFLSSFTGYGVARSDRLWNNMSVKVAVLGDGPLTSKTKKKTMDSSLQGHSRYKIELSKSRQTDWCHSLAGCRTMTATTHRLWTICIIVTRLWQVLALDTILKRFKESPEYYYVHLRDAQLYNTEWRFVANANLGDIDGKLETARKYAQLSSDFCEDHKHTFWINFMDCTKTTQCVYRHIKEVEDMNILCES
jgi:hypothetical protein